LDCARDGSVCAAADPNTKCVVLDDRGTTSKTDDAAFCLPTCKLGDPAANEDKCRGRIDLVCSEDTAGTGLGYCRPACRSYLDPTGKGGEGDLGYCTRVCDCNDDCARADAVCEPQAKLMTATGRAGVCASKAFASGGARPNLPCK